MTIRWKHVLALAIVAGVLGLATAWSGLISVRASTGHFAATDWFLHWVMRNSVRTASLGVDVPPLDDPALLPLAAGHFETGCALCHGSPVQPRSPAALAMLPPPPDLKDVVSTWSDAQLFEIVQHGVRFTGMPAWPAVGRKDEVWAMVAFLRKLPAMDAKSYYEMSGLHVAPMEGEVGPLPLTCESCHAEKRLNDGSHIPRLAGQSEAYLLESLKAYLDGKRPSGVMEVAIGSLPADALPALAKYYAGQTRSQRQPMAADAALIEKGCLLAETGRAADKIPACLSCHDRPGANPVYPRLSGQGFAYLAQQLTLFSEGTRGGTSYSHLMTEAAKNLKADDIAAVSAYFGQRQ